MKYRLVIDIETDSPERNQLIVDNLYGLYHKAYAEGMFTAGTGDCLVGVANTAKVFVDPMDEAPPSREGGDRELLQRLRSALLDTASAVLDASGSEVPNARLLVLLSTVVGKLMPHETDAR